MNKTININLGGFFFHIDENAYKKLRKYLDAIAKSLSDDPQGKNEIIADIEARISELLSEKITDVRQVVNETDIDEIIIIMGQPEDYSDSESSYSDANYSYARNNSVGKKLFRDGDDKFLGGVASGIAYYFNIDTIWIRLAFIIFAFSGTTIIGYIILWVLLPEAKTTAEKLQMEGEPVNIDNIEKKIRDEFSAMSDKVRTVAGDVSERIKDGANEFSDSFSKKKIKNKGNKAKSGLQDFIDVLGKIILVLFKVVGKFIGVLLIIIAASVIFTLIIGGFSIGSLEFLNVDGHILQYPPFFYDSIIPKGLLTLFSFLLIGIPFLIFFILGLRILSSNVKQFNKPTSLTLLGIWIVALLALIFTGLEHGTSYANRGKTVQKESLNFVENDTINIQMINDDSIYFPYNLRRNSNKEEVEIDNEQKVYSNEIYVDVEKSNSAETYLIIQKNSRGRSKIKASKSAEKISYNYSVIDKKLLLDAYYLSAYKNIWKDEDVRVTLYVPENITVYFDNSTRSFLYDVKNTTDTYDRDMANHYFLMTKDGLHSEELKLIEETEEE